MAVDIYVDNKATCQACRIPKRAWSALEMWLQLHHSSLGCQGNACAKDIFLRWNYLEVHMVFTTASDILLSSKIVIWKMQGL